ncbi:MAG TPA: glycosyltransferase family 2 protein [Candidatus Saccharimonadales bacterium]|nr:glycosyltransferase family 2 protein [Candidatus Saccharimonadales bacterium]
MHAISVVIPAFNAGVWLPETTAKIHAAVAKAKITDYEIIIVNDGSTDGTRETLAAMQKVDKHLVVVQLAKNEGRFLARKAGIKRATKEYVLFVDSRVHVDEGSLAYVVRQMKKNPELQAWNGHVRIRLDWNIFARFWDAVTFIAWRRYLRRPRLVQYGIEDFDYYPKGTGFFLAPRKLLMSYINAFKAQIDDLHFVSDDTALLRNIARDVKITIAPEFSCLYFSRDRLRPFIVHTLHRGTFFVDGFLQRGNRFFVPLIGFLILSPLALVALCVWPVPIITLGLIGWLLELLAALLLGVPAASALSFWLLTPVFALLYGLGIWRGVYMLLRQKPFVRTLQGFILQHRSGVSFAAASTVYALCTLFYMGGAATHCTQSLLSFPGDNTAGLIALFSINNHSPWFGHTQVFSYPYGENLWQPTQVTAQALFIPFWLLAKLAGPVCAFNLLGIIGFMSAALTMFGFMRWLLRGRSMVAMVAGFAVAFTPYLQIKTGVHISYIYEAVFIAAIWFFFLLWQQPRLKWALLLGLSVALFAYTDGYFILLGGVLVAALLLSTLVYQWWVDGRRITAEFGRRLKLLAVSAAALVVLLLPVLYVFATSSRAINGALASTRDSIKREAQVYGARPLEYLVPNAFNPLTNHIYGDYVQRNNHGSNPSENVLSLSLTMLTLTIILLAALWRSRRRKQPLLTGLRFPPSFLVFVFATIFVAALLCSFPPKAGPLRLPSDVIIHFVSLWRVFARLSVIVNIALVVLGSLGLAVLVERIRGRGRQIALCLLVFALLFAEYLTFTPPRPVSGYKNVPQLYYWLHTQPQYKAIAEYPLDEFAASGYPVFYNTYQRIDGKELLNGIISNKDAELARLAVRDLQAPQAVPGLRTLGIDFVVVHMKTPPGDIPGLKLVHQSPEPVLSDTVWGYAVLPGSKALYVAIPTQGFHAPVIISAIHELQEVGHDGVLSFRALSGHGTEQRVVVTLTAKALAAGGQATRIVQGSSDIWQGIVPAAGTTISFEADPHEAVHILPVNPKTDATLWLSDFDVR